MTSASAGDDGLTDAILLDEPTTADLRVKVTEAWQEFARALATQIRGCRRGHRSR